MCSGSSGSLLGVKSDDNQAISLYVKNLVSDFDLSDPSTHDVAINRLSSSDMTKQKVHDMYEDIRMVIPKTMPVHESPVDNMIENRNLRPAAFNIIVSDVSDAVSEYSNHRIKIFSY